VGGEGFEPGAQVVTRVAGEVGQGGAFEDDAFEHAIGHERGFRGPPAIHGLSSDAGAGHDVVHGESVVAL